MPAANRPHLLKHEGFRSRFLEDARDLIVYLPPGYDESGGRRYAVLYLQDGQNLFDGATAYVRGMDWHVGETADRWIASGEVEPLIIVGIYHAGPRRIEEYTPTRVRRLGGGKADLYGRMLIEEIQPFIGTCYRTAAGPERTGLGGSSLGGLAAMYLGLRYSGIFGKLAALSPSVWWGQREILRIVRKARLEQRPKIWLDIGDEESARAVADVALLRDALIERCWAPGKDLHCAVVERAAHNEAAWGERVGDFLKFLFPARGPGL
jgi:predicted alpha/beta superfamily hydrolase